MRSTVLTGTTRLPQFKAKRTNTMNKCVMITVLLIVAAGFIWWFQFHLSENVDQTLANMPKSSSHVVAPVPTKSSSHIVVPLPTAEPKSNKQSDSPVAIKKDSAKKDSRIHFIHIPKCGGTTMTAILRQIQCSVDPIKNADCCLNPGFCDWHAFRRCATISGCINHFPNRPMIFKALPSIAIFREPISRIISAWFYRGHSPNNDFFQVRPYFKDIRDGKLPKVTFDEYTEMPEYHNIQTRMLGADSFPYRNVTVTEKVFEKAVEAVDHLFYIGLQEEFEVSSLALVREMHVNVTIDIKKERDQSNPQMMQQKNAIRGNEKMMARLREVNSYDLRLYQLVNDRFCEMIRKYPDLFARVEANGKVKCDSS